MVISQKNGIPKKSKILPRKYQILLLVGIVIGIIVAIVATIFFLQQKNSEKQKFEADKEGQLFMQSLPQMINRNPTKKTCFEIKSGSG